MVILQCFLHWCSGAEKRRTLESFKRLDEEDRFLKIEWDEHKKAFNLSFTGSKRDLGTTFIFKHENNSVIKPYTIHPAGRPNYILAVEGKSLVVKTLPNITMHPDMSNYKFLNKRVSLHYTDNGTRRKTDFHVIQSQSIPRRNIKSTKSGKASLTFNWKDCGAWIGIKSIE